MDKQPGGLSGRGLSRAGPRPGPSVAQHAATPPSGTVTFLFSDIEGSTRLLERLRGRYADLLAEHRRILREAFVKWNGHEVDTQGDSFFVAFSRASDALSCAVDAQRSLAESEWPDGVAVKVRIGIHTGEPLPGGVAGVDYVGMDVHRAARIAAAGHGGQILVSSTTRDIVSDALAADVTLLDLGPHRLKDLRDEMRLYQVAAAGLGTDFAPLVTAAAEEPAPIPGEPPYRGLEAFEERDAAMFFGRDGIVAELVDRVERARFVALIGASGSGKSSILRAGLIPSLRATDRVRRVLLMTPTAHPLEELAGALEPDASPSRIAALADEILGDPRALAISLRALGKAQSGSSRAGVAIAIDQLEEVFTLCRSEDERQAFLAAIGHAAGIDEASADSPPDADRAHVVVTLRADFYAHLAPYADLRAAAAASQLYVGAMSAEELRHAIEEPARLGGWDFTPGLVDLLLRDVGDEPGALPLLSHALLETWHRRRGTTMTLRGYSESGGVKGAIARTADRVYGGELSESQERIARDIFIRLTELGEGAQDTRRRARMDELVPADEKRASEVRTVIKALADARLVTVGEDTVEVAHEALIREWPTLREWLRADRDALRIQRRLTDAAMEWELSGMDSSLLFRGARLAQAREATLYKGVLNPQEERFLDASVAFEESEEREREMAKQREVDAAQALAAAEGRRAEEAARSASGLRRRAFLLAGAVVLASVLAGVAVILARDSAANATLAEQHAREALDNQTLAERRAGEASDSAALAQQREQEAHDSEVAAQLQATRALAERLGSDATQLLLSGREPELAALLALNGLRVGYTSQADAALQRAGRRGSIASFDSGAVIDSLVATPDANMLVTSGGGTIRIWDVATTTSTQSLPAPLGSPDTGEYSYLELSDDGTVLLASGYGGQGVVYTLGADADALPTEIAIDCSALTAQTGIRALSGDGRVLATYLRGDEIAGRAGEVVFVSLPDCAPMGQPIRVDQLNDPALSHDGTRLTASILDHNVMKVWDTATGREISTLAGVYGNFWHSSFSFDGQQVVTGTFDGPLQVWDVSTGVLRQTYRGHGGGVEHARLSRDGSRLLTASGDSTARIWDTSSATELQRFVHGDEVSEAVLSADDKVVFTAGIDGIARLWSTTGETSAFIAGDGEVSGLAFSVDGQQLASAAGDHVRIYDLAAEKVVAEVAKPGVGLVVYSPGGDSLLAVSGLRPALLDPVTLDEIRYFSVSEQEEASSAASFSADGQMVLTPLSGTFNEVALSSVATGQHTKLFQLSTGVLSPDGTKVAGFFPGRYTVSDAATNDTVMSVGLGQNEGRPIDIAFTPDSKRIVSGDYDNVVRVRDAATGEILLEMPGHASPIRQVRVSADGAFALTGSDDGSARLWNLETGQLVRLFAGHDGRAVTSIAISPDGELVAVGSTDGTVIVTPVALDDLAASVCAQLSRDLTDSERTAYSIDSDGPTCR